MLSDETRSWEAQASINRPLDFPSAEGAGPADGGRQTFQKCQLRPQTALSHACERKPFTRGHAGLQRERDRLQPRRERDPARLTQGTREPGQGGPSGPGPACSSRPRFLSLETVEFCPGVSV